MTSQPQLLKTPSLEFANELYQSRFDEYRKAMMFTTEQANNRLMKLHVEGVNVGEHISDVIGQSHMAYMSTLSRCGVGDCLIR